MSARQIAATSSASMGDILTTAGLGDADGLRRLLGAWDNVLLRFTPDLVVSRSGAGRCACRARKSSADAGRRWLHIATGRNPAISAAARHDVSGDEAVTLEVLNSVLRSRGETGLDHLPQIFSGDARLVLTFPLLDPYFARRTEPLLGPLLDHVPVAAVPKKRCVFAYLSRGYPLHRDIPAALLAHAPVLRFTRRICRSTKSAT